MTGVPSGEHRLEVPTGEVIAGRYRLDAVLGRGGMGVVHRAWDMQVQRPVAIKRLSGGVGDTRVRARMFEREYHTLVGLQHPRIIEVLDYGFDDSGPYYVMELLDGRDLRELSPLPYATVCAYMRDIASSLALLHSRRLLHRDLSPRNVRVTSEGRAKLLDFGALASFGRNRNVVGTAPLIPPEALSGASLDQRADLYSLGALMYWSLTGTHAYRVRQASELEDAWRRQPMPPSRRGDGDRLIPRQLDDLVLALLSKNPLARPASAAEVIALLNTIAKLPPDREPLGAISYLRGGKTVGRPRERARLRRSLKQAARGRGAALVIESLSGMGGSRALSDLALEAQLRGVTAVVVDASSETQTLGVLQRVLHELSLHHPEDTREVVERRRDTLGFLLPEARESGLRWSSTPRRGKRASSPLTEADPRERRLDIQSDLRQTLLELADAHPLLLAVDNLHQADEASATLLSSLVHAAPGHPLMLAMVLDPASTPVAPEPLLDVRSSAACVSLRGLTPAEVHALVESTFGAVPHVERLAAWLHGLTGGAPEGCVELMHHLVDSEVIRFTEGVWALPQVLVPEELPEGLEQVMRARVARLSPAARRMASAVALHHGPMSTERCIALAEVEHIEAPLRVLEELTRCEVLAESDDAYLPSHSAMRKVLLSYTAGEDRLSLHRVLGRIMQRETRSGPEAQLDAGWHLLHGGEAGRGAEILARAGLTLLYDVHGLPRALPALRAALGVYREQGRSRHELMPLLMALTVGGYYANFDYIDDHADESVAVAQQVLGLGLTRRLRPLLGRRLSLYLGLGKGLLGFVLRHGRRGIASFRQAVTQFATMTVVGTGTATITLDAGRARGFAELLRPFEVLGENHGACLAYRMCQGLAMLPSDRIAETLDRLRHVLERLEAPAPLRELPAEARELLYTASLYAVGVLECFTEDEAALRRADTLEARGKRLYDMFAAQIRTLYHALRGESAEAERHGELVERHALSAGSAWQVELWSPSSMILAHELTREVVGVKRVMGLLSRLVERVPSLQTHLLLSQASYHKLRGDFATSQTFSDPIIRDRIPRSFIGWSPTVAGEIRNRVKLGTPEQGVELGRWALEQLEPRDMLVTTMTVGIVAELALAEAATGAVEQGASRLDAYLELIGPRGGPASRANLHAARAEIAMTSDDEITARHHLLAMRAHARNTGNPTLLARCERLLRSLDDPHREGRAPSRRPEADAEAGSGSAEATQTTRVLRSGE